MGLKSIIDIEVNDEGFKEFKDTFDEYRKGVKDANKEWTVTAKALKMAGKGYENIVDLSEQVAGHASDAADEQERFDRAARRSSSSMGGLVRNTRDVVRGIREATRSLAGWAGIVTGLGGLLAFGGLFGINRMAAGVAARGRESSGYGSGYRTGPMNAFKTDFGDMLDAQGILSAVNAAQTSVDKTPFIGLGMKEGEYTGDTADVSRNALVALRKWLKAHPGANSQLWQGFRFSDLFSNQDIQRVQGWSDTEFNTRIAEYGRDRNTLGLGAGTTAGYAGLMRQFDRSGLELQNAVASTLAPLTGPLKDLSDAIVKATKSLLGSNAFKDAVDGLAVGIQSFAKYLTSPEFNADLASVMDTLEDLAKGLKKVINVTFGTSPDEGMARSERRFGLPQGAFRSIEYASGYGGAKGMALKDPRWAISNALDALFASNSNRLGAAMKQGGPDDVHRVLSDIMRQVPGMTAQQQAAAVRKMEIRIYTPPGSDVSTTMNGVPQ